MAKGRLRPRTLFVSITKKIAVISLILGALATTNSSRALADEQRADRLSLGLYVAATTLSPDFVNNGINEINNVTGSLNPPLAPIDEIKAAPWFQIEGRFFISDKFVSVLGYGTMERSENLDLQPAMDTEVLVEGQVQTKTLHAGLDYYFPPTTSGDVTWRWFAGGGFMSAIETKAKAGGSVATPDTLIDLFNRVRGEGAGFWVEGGIHLMIPGRYSFIANVFYRYLNVPRLRQENADGSVGDYVLDPNGDFANLDLSGLGLRIGINIDLWNDF